MKITRKEFVQAMTSNSTIFAGVTRIKDLDYIRNVIYNFMEDKNVIREKRNCVARSHDLVFTGNSHLTLDHMDFYEINCGNCIAYVARTKVGNEPMGYFVKSMVYIVE